MSFAEMLEQLETLTAEERQQLIDRALEIDEPELSPEIRAMIEERLTEHDRDPGAALTYEEFKAGLHSLLKR